MSEMLIPIGGAGGKNRGSQYKIPENAQAIEMFGSIFFPLPSGVYKKLVLPNGQPALPSDDGGDAAVTMSKEFFKKQAIKIFGIASITNFSLSMFAHKQVRLTWAKPSQGLWSGARFVFKYDSMPTSVTDGFYTFDSADVHYETGALQERQLYIRAFNYVTTNDGRWYDNGNVSATIRVTGISGSVTLSTGAGTWTVPPGVYKIRYILVGNGGEGGQTRGNVGASPGGGGGYFTQSYMNVTPGQSIPWVVPQKVSIYQNTEAFYTKFGDVKVSFGKSGFQNADYDLDSPGGDGGSGGGGGFLNGMAYGAPGGSDGSDGVHGSNNLRRSLNYYARGGTGQHTSTRGFNGVLYSGGGGGGGASGGAGGGGDGFRQYPTTNYDIGKNGVDGLGGGGGGGTRNRSNGSRGGTGCIYIAWGSAMNDGS